MADSPSGKRKLKKRNIPKIGAEIYSKIHAGDLLLFAIHFVQEQRLQVNIEDVVSASFLLFPQKFGLKNYSKWPDSALVSRRWSDCKSKGLIGGDAEIGFKLTFKGMRIAQRVAKALGLFKPIKKKANSVIRKASSKSVIVPKPKAISVTPVKKPQVVMRKRKAKKSSEKKKPIVVEVKKSKSIIGKAKAKTLSLKKVEVQQPAKKEERSVIQEKAASKRPNPSPIKKARPIWVEKSTPPAPMPVKEIARKQEKKSVVENTPKVDKALFALSGKFIKVMERSDAFVMYRKNGSKANVGEFDFRSLLLCTMESSNETLIKNVKLYKGYAEIHNRQDLLSLLDYCERRFVNLLSSQKKLKK